MELSQINTAYKLLENLEREIRALNYKQEVVRECKDRLSGESVLHRICLSKKEGYISGSLIVKKETMMAFVALIKAEIEIDTAELEISVGLFKKQIQDGFESKGESDD